MRSKCQVNVNHVGNVFAKLKRSPLIALVDTWRYFEKKLL